jgi:hypothetical protein
MSPVIVAKKIEQFLGRGGPCRRWCQFFQQQINEAIDRLVDRR